MAAHLRAGIAQVHSVVGDIEANLKKHLEAIAEARTSKVEVLLFPEVSLVGHSAASDTVRLARDRSDPIVATIAEAAGDMCVIFGLIEEGPAAQFYNSAIAVRQGQLLFIHRKVNLPTYGALEEGKHYAAGRYIDTFELGSRWRAGLLICADVWNPALVYLSALHGATVLFVPISSAREAVGAEFDNPGGWETCVRFFAMMYGLPVIMANRVGQEGGLTFWGGSRILDPFGRELARAGEGEEIIVADLDYERIRKARYLLPTVRDSNLALILRESERLASIVGVPESVRKPS